MQILPEPLTSLDDYLAWAGQRPKDEQCEVVDGQPVVTPSPTGWHQLALANLLVTLRQSCPENCTVLPAPWDWLLWETPTSFERDAVAKRHDYARAGLDHYWIVDPGTPQVAIYRRVGDRLELVTHAVGHDDVVVRSRSRCRCARRTCCADRIGPSVVLSTVCGGISFCRCLPLV